jgi:hypothetical protein
MLREVGSKPVKGPAVKLSRPTCLFFLTFFLQSEG